MKPLHTDVGTSTGADIMIYLPWLSVPHLLCDIWAVLQCSPLHLDFNWLNWSNWLNTLLRSVSEVKDSGVLSKYHLLFEKCIQHWILIKSLTNLYIYISMVVNLEKVLTCFMYFTEWVYDFFHLWQKFADQGSVLRLCENSFYRFTWPLAPIF